MKSVHVIFRYILTGFRLVVTYFECFESASVVY